MPNEKVVLLLQTKVLPQYRAEILQAARANKLPTRAEPGVEAYYQTARKDDPNTLLFFVVFAAVCAASICDKINSSRPLSLFIFFAAAKRISMSVYSGCNVPFN